MQFSITLTLILIVLALTGCGVPSPRGFRSYDDGAVIVRILPRRLTDNQYFHVSPKIIAERESSNQKEAQTYQITPLKKGYYNTPIYSASLPEGTYRILESQDIDCNYYCSELDNHIPAGKFEIRKSQLTDLGTIILATTGKSDTALLVHNSTVDPNTSEQIREMAPGLSSTLQKPILTWLPDTVPGSMPEQFMHAIQSGSNLASPKELSNGDFLYGDSHGQIIQWHQKNSQFTYQSIASVPIEAINVSQDGSWLAGGLGTLLKRDPKDGSWQSIRGNLPYGLTLDIFEWRGQNIVALLDRQDLKIYTAKQGEINWSLIATRDAIKAYTMMGENTWRRPLTRLVDNHLIIAGSGRIMANLDLETQKVEEYPPQEVVSELAATGDNILRCFCTGKILESRDYGKTWTNVNSSSRNFRFYKPPVFKDKEHGVALAITDPSNINPRLIYTSDSGKTWSISTTPLSMERKSAPPKEWYLSYSKINSNIYLSDQRGVIMASTDNGKSWGRSYQSTLQ